MGGPERVRYGDNTSCVEVRGPDGTVPVLDAGTGIRRLGATLVDAARRVDLLVTHLHLDHIIGFGFFAPLYVPGLYASGGSRGRPGPCPPRDVRATPPPGDWTLPGERAPPCLGAVAGCGSYALTRVPRGS